ncbi:MAG: V-type ATP synthase subunit F [Oscillospiraceae bacterium]|nr:V-type ATP synthase subunit F [Oscillospiraceae bacterium]
MYKIGVLGEKDSIIAFSALGLEVFPVEGEQEAIATFRKLAKDGEHAIIYVTESFYETLAPEIDKYKDSLVPAVILIPGRDGSLGLGQTALNAAVERAVGANIL